MLDFIALVGRLLFVLVFLGSGMNHLTQSKAMAGYAQSKRLPAATFFVIASGVWIIVGAILVLLGLWGDLGALMLAPFLVATAFVFHGFWGESDPQARMNEMTHFLKDLGLAGASLVLFVLFAEWGADLGFTLSDPLF